MYADDTNLTDSSNNIAEIQDMLQKDITEWLAANKLTLNVIKNIMLIGSRQRLAVNNETIDLSVNGIQSKQVNEAKCLGLTMTKI